jgi:hypothetical protein
MEFEGMSEKINLFSFGSHSGPSVHPNPSPIISTFAASEIIPESFGLFTIIEASFLKFCEKHSVSKKRKTSVKRIVFILI